ncbi:signal peptidase I [Curtobacterium sp. MCBD17_040]|uniref:signal peptidase I n=1 Tax=Curtobacterium sp. MCBD17_040 TaxID=2175674 RepID=UPI000DAAD338|nr:signal peptidase I [Curtobacterium sp. MCBD17_040]WIB64211.1 signal peptidase I [Curtobacterium sp. MCBD17_040]
MTTTNIAIPAPAAVPAVRVDRLRDLRDWNRLVIATVARGVIATILGMALWAVAPAVIGWHPTTVMTGSMEPRLQPGDVVVSKPVAPTSLHLGQVLLYDDPDQPGELRLHRFHEAGEDGQIITKGDANPQADSTPITRSAVHGVGFIRVPYIGMPVMWLRDGEWKKVAILVLALTAMAFLSTIDAPLRRGPVVAATDDDEAGEGLPDDVDDLLIPVLVDEDEDDDADVPSGAPAAQGREGRRRLPARLFALIVGSAVALAAVGTGLLLPSKAEAAPFGAMTSTSASFGAASSFSCLGRTVTYSPTIDYAFNAASGTSETDLGSSGTTATLSSGVTRVAGTCGSSPYVTLDGATGQVTSTSTTKITAPSVFTVEAWIRTSTAAGKVIGFGNSQTGSSSAYDRQLYINSAGAVSFSVYNSGNITLTSTKTVTDGRWHHVVGTMSSSGMVLYVDGVSVATNTNTAAEPDSGWWRIGYDNLSGWQNAPTSNYYKGDLDDVAVYNSALSAAQVSALYSAGR